MKLPKLPPCPAEAPAGEAHRSALARTRGRRWEFREFAGPVDGHRPCRPRPGRRPPGHLVRAYGTRTPARCRLYSLFGFGDIDNRYAKEFVTYFRPLADALVEGRHR